jgi:CheY-like chemotaxis protein
MDGLKLMRLVRVQWPTMPFVLLSGYMSQQTGEAFAGMFGDRARYFTKPVEPSILEGRDHSTSAGGLVPTPRSGSIQLLPRSIKPRNAPKAMPEIKVDQMIGFMT